MWHTPEERPKEKVSQFIYIVRRYGKNYLVDCGRYVNCKYYNPSEYVNLEEAIVPWDKIYLWCYCHEFSKMIQTTFKRQRNYHLRKKTK